MADLVKKIRTDAGDLQIDYGALANKPTAGSAIKPIYMENGVPKATTYTLEASVPADAKFTDTTTLTSMTGVLPINKGGTGKTTAAESLSALGAVAKSGDTMTGNLSLKPTSVPTIELYAPANSDGAQAYTRLCKNASATVDYGTQFRDYTFGGKDANKSTTLMICDKQDAITDKLQLIIQANGANTYYKVYGEHNKPALSDLGLDFAIQANISQSYFGALHASRYGQVKRFRAQNSAANMTAGKEYTICTLPAAYRPQQMTYSSYVCIAATSSGGSFGHIYIDTSGAVKFTPYVNLTPSSIMIVDVAYI